MCVYKRCTEHTECNSKSPFLKSPCWFCLYVTHIIKQFWQYSVKSLRKFYWMTHTEVLPSASNCSETDYLSKQVIFLFFSYKYTVKKTFQRSAMANCYINYFNLDKESSQNFNLLRNHWKIYSVSTNLSFEALLIQAALSKLNKTFRWCRLCGARTQEGNVLRCSEVQIHMVSWKTA